LSWEDTFTDWAKAPGTTEQTKCSNAEQVIRNAINANGSPLNGNITRVFAQGSYANRTNVPGDSDVDVCILRTDYFFAQYPEGHSDSSFGNTSSSYTYSQFKDEVESALVAYLGRDGVTRGKKAFDLHENTYRIDSDAIACFEYRLYRTDGTWISGTAFVPDSGTMIFNFPEQNYKNGVVKNDSNRTNSGFKGNVRILKRLRHELIDAGYKSAESIPSFLIECLAWNVDDIGFLHSTWTDDVRYILTTAFNATLTADRCKDWLEVNGIKYLFRPSQQWTRAGVHQFLNDAWGYLGFE